GADDRIPAGERRERRQRLEPRAAPIEGGTSALEQESRRRVQARAYSRQVLGGPVEPAPGGTPEPVSRPAADLGEPAASGGREPGARGGGGGVGVGGGAAAGRSQRGVSCSWPTAETTGTRDPAIARTTASSLQGSRSSKLPPPRATTTTSTSGCAVSAPSP